MSLIRDFLTALAILILPAVFIWALPDRAWAAEPSLAEFNRLVDQTNFVVNAGCSGTLLDKEEALILTANHCVDQQYATVERETVKPDGTVEKKEVRVGVPGAVRQLYFDDKGVQVREVIYRMEIVKREQATDLALLKIRSEIPNSEVSKIACEPPQRGEEVYVVGNPTGDLYSSIVKGNVAALNRTYETIGWANNVTANREEGLMQIAGGIVGGNSGGAVYDEEQNLVGVPVIGNRVNEVIAFAVPQPAVLKFLRSALSGIKFKEAHDRVVGHCKTMAGDEK